jgi:crotonobetaine/carnitine-CoA ligase
MPEPLAFADRTLPRALALKAAKIPDKTLLRWWEGERTYAETLDTTARFAGTLQSAGVGYGDRVTLLCNNRIELLDTFLACGWLGAIFTPLNVAARGAQLQHVLTNSDPRVLIVEPELVEHLDAVTEPLPSLEHIWVTGEPPRAEWRGLPLEPFPGHGEPVDAYPVRPGDTLAILYTSGTTGPSKGVMCPHAQLYLYGFVTARNLDLGSDDVLYTILPMFHTNALNTLWQAILIEGTYAFGKRFSASRFLGEARDAGATATFLLGAMVHILLKREPSPEDADHKLRIALSPGTTDELCEAARSRFHLELLDGYGSTETSVPFSNRLHGERPGSMGWLLEDLFEAKVVDEHDVELPRGVSGELILRPKEPWGFASGYWRMPEKTVETWRNLWFHTGDRVVRDEDEIWRFLDRFKDSIRRRGENISSYEVETALQDHPDVATAAVIPVPSDLGPGDDEVMAFVMLRPGAQPDPVGLVRHLEPRLAYFAIPRYIDFVDEVPLTENGKVRKFVLRERGVTETTWDREAAGVTLKR